MKNHFVLSYAGNKREEVENIFNVIEPDLTNIDTIIEPFCGTSALSFYISQKMPKRFKYVLNDNNPFLIELYKILQDDNKTKAFIAKVLKMVEGIDKEKFNVIIKNNDVESWFIKGRIFNMRVGLFPIDGRHLQQIKQIERLEGCPIISFLRNENIEFLNGDSVVIMEKFQNNDKCFIFLDPPYLNSCNSFYLDANTNIYEYLYKNDIKEMKAKIYLCLEDNWIIRLLFQRNKIHDSYCKLYQATKRKTKHFIISQ
jgi:site-specific DNA-adenine methylase